MDAENPRLPRFDEHLDVQSGLCCRLQRYFDKLRDAEQAAEHALQVLAIARGKAASALEQTLEDAARLLDGTRVFRDANGAVWTEHGEQVDVETAQSIHWRGGEPAWETFRAMRESWRRRNRGIQVNKLARYRNELEDEQNPPAEQRLKEITEMFALR
jgi:hypothetical protein